jgi:uncharacterized protein (DUF433 family)
MPNITTERITRNPEIFGGKACLAGHRIRVMDVVFWHDDLNMSSDEIVEAYPELSLSDVHSALAYYFDNLDEIRKDLRHNNELADQLRSRFPSKLKKKLLHGAD